MLYYERRNSIILFQGGVEISKRAVFCITVAKNIFIPVLKNHAMATIEDLGGFNHMGRVV